MNEDVQSRRIRVLKPGDGRSTSVAWSPDGTRLAVGSDDHSIYVLTPEGRVIWEGQGHRAEASSVAWSPDGRRLASGARDGPVRVWDGTTGHLLLSLAGHASGVGVNCVAWSQDGRRLASVGFTVRVWDTTNRDLLWQYKYEDPVWSVAWSPDGLRLASSCFDKTVSVWNASSGDLLRRYDGHKNLVTGVAWSPNGHRIASSSAGRTIRLWNSTTGNLLQKCEGHTGRVWSVAWNPNSRLLASSSEDETIRLWDPENGRELNQFETLDGNVHSVAFSPDGTRLAFASGDVELWHVSDLVAAVTRFSAVASWLTRQAATVGRRTSWVEQSDTWVPRLEGAEDRCLGVLWNEQMEDMAPAIALSHEGRRLFAGHGLGRVLQWDLKTVQVRWERVYRPDERVPSIGRWIRYMALSPDGRKLVLASGDSAFEVWDTETGELERTIESSAECAAWSPDGHRFASGYHDIRVWDTATGASRLQCTGHAEDTILSMAWSPDGSRLASASTDQTVRVWDTRTGVSSVECVGHEQQVLDVAWSPDGHRLASASEDKTVRVWDSTTGRLLVMYTGHMMSVSGVAWSPDGCLLASNSHDESVQIWDSSTAQKSQCFQVPNTRTSSKRLRVVWSSSGAFLVSSHRDAIRLWDTRDLTKMAIPHLETPVRPLPTDLAPLPAALAALHRLNLYPPLSLLRDLRDLLAGHPAGDNLRSLASHPGLRRLTSLHWPGPARTGLAALLLRELRADEWKPPPELAPDDLRTTLARALAGDPIPPDAPPPPVALLTRAAETVDERLLTLLAALGPDAVAADPGLPLRVLHQTPSLPRLSAPQRRLLGLRLAPAESGPAQGTGTGLDRTGIASTGTILSLVPSQLIQPWELLAWRHQNGGLLYRARTGREPPHFRPAVLVLDVSPPCFGPVEGLTRPAAHALASTLRRLGLPVVLVAAEGEGTIHLLDDPADLLKLLTLRTLKAVDASRVMTTAERLSGHLRGGVMEPVVVLLTHPWWGAEAPDLGTASHLRALFVQYPGREVRPRWADRCERWESLGPGQHANLPQVLGRLIG